VVFPTAEPPTHFVFPKSTQGRSQSGAPGGSFNHRQFSDRTCAGALFFCFDDPPDFKDGTKQTPHTQSKDQSAGILQTEFHVVTTMSRPI